MAASTSAASASQQTSSAATSSALSIPQSAPAGLLTITQPPQTTIAFFKIAPSQPITFAWNFSYVLSTPASLTVSAICENGVTYPVGPTNGIIPGAATSVVWDAYAWQQNNPNSPLAQATYTLEIFDNRGPGSSRAPGLLQPNNALRFALYTPQSYTPIASGNLLTGWQCTGCNNAALAAHPAFFCVCLTIFVMFASGLAILRNSAR
ncbi:hypothetical protein BJV78DRAFT_1123730 [Lactifluus subvellereus]|nr:hypothetical protein BJV78DRAFT_1123730 [Lactifluus subvellereus]